MDYKMKARKPQNETQLFESCQEAWEVMDIDYLQSLVGSKSRRIEAVIQARGGMTKTTEWLMNDG